MKKQINPDLLRNSIFTNFTAFNNVVTSKNANSLIVFQDIEIKSNLIKFFEKFGILVLDFQILRTYHNLNVNFTYFNKNNLFSNKIVFFNRLLSKLNSLKFDLLNFYHFKESINSLKKNSVFPDIKSEKNKTDQIIDRNKIGKIHFNKLQYQRPVKHTNKKISNKIINIENLRNNNK